MLAGAIALRSPPFDSTIETRRSACGYGNARSSTASTSAKSALLAPIPSASVAVAASVKPGACRSRRAASEASRASASSRGKPKTARLSSRRRSGFPSRRRAARRASSSLVTPRARGVGLHREVALQLLLELAVELGALAEKREPAQQRFETRAHQAVSSTRAMASTSASQCSRSASSCFFPRGVSR